MSTAVGALQCERKRKQSGSEAELHIWLSGCRNAECKGLAQRRWGIQTEPKALGSQGRMENQVQEQEWCGSSKRAGSLGDKRLIRQSLGCCLVCVLCWELASLMKPLPLGFKCQVQTAVRTRSFVSHVTSNWKWQDIQANWQLTLSGAKAENCQPSLSWALPLISSSCQCV